MDKIKNIIIIVIVIIIIIITTILLLKIKNNDEKVEDPDEYELTSEEENLEITNEIKDVEDISKFTIVESCIQEYYNKINNNSSDYYEIDYEKNRIPTVEEEEKNQIKLGLLSKEYIEKNKITVDNIDENIETIEEDVTAVAIQMKVLVNDPVEKYVVYGFIVNREYKILNTFYMFVNLDTEQKTFSIEPINEKYTSIEDISFENDNEQIEFNESNIYEEKILNNEQIAKKYFSIYKTIVLSNPNFLYNHFMQEEYKEKRFGTAEEFEKYIINNKEEIEQLLLKQYLVNDLENGTQYVLKDQYGNMYIVNVSSLPMEFTLELDTYTVPTENFTTEYDQSDEKNKVRLNVDKWIQMLNNRDYKTAYNMLDETFRNNKFGSQEKFEAYMRENFASHYELGFSSFQEEGNTYVQKIELTDIAENEETKEINIIMQLKEETDFVMSFEI